MSCVCEQAEDKSNPKKAADAELALEMYCYRVRAFMGQYFFQLGCKLDAIIFTAGDVTHL